ncbi:COBW domain-containing protein 1 [Termitomyces sp. J132]|nr:COBW domain-containing protein 1 [Termitomyces sp. J132]
MSSEFLWSWTRTTRHRESLFIVVATVYSVHRTLIEHETTPQHTHKRVPLTIICGFLGAGKSTLLKRILTERHGYRIAVIMNEFGDTADIESRTVNVSSSPEEQSEEILELANGCLCCSIKDSGVAAIEKLMQRKGAFDHILLETTGLADPGPIASIFWHNEEFASGLGRDIVLDGVICVVDAFFGKQARFLQMEEDHSEDHIGESLKQIAGSDVILLNKVDLVASDVLAEVESLIQQINPAAPIYSTIRGDVDLGRIMALDTWIRAVLWENSVPGSSAGSETPELLVLRCKGLITVEDGTQYVLQGVRSMYDMAKIERDAEGDIGVPQIGKIVLIGKGLDETVRRSLENAIKPTTDT